MFELNSRLLEQLTKRKVSLEDLQKQEELCVLEKFDHTVAFDLGLFARNAGLSLFPTKTIAIDITLANGHCMFRTVTNAGSGPDNDQWIARKQRTALRFNHSSFFMGCKKGDKTPEERFFIPAKDYAFHGGAVPIYVYAASSPVAILTVSGLKQEEDHLLAVQSIQEFAKSTGRLDDDYNLD